MKRKRLLVISLILILLGSLVVPGMFSATEEPSHRLPTIGKSGWSTYTGTILNWKDPLNWRSP